MTDLNIFQLSLNLNVLKWLINLSLKFFIWQKYFHILNNLLLHILNHI